MDKEDYVSLEVAKMLKDKGFDEYTSSYFVIEEYKCIFNGEQFIFRVGDIDRNSKLCPECVLAKRPTLYQAKKWLRKKYNIHIEIGMLWDEDEKGFWTFDAYYTNVAYKQIYSCKGEYNSFEEASNEGVFEVLKLI